MNFGYWLSQLPLVVTLPKYCKCRCCSLYILKAFWLQPCLVAKSIMNDEQNTLQAPRSYAEGLRQDRKKKFSCLIEEGWPTFSTRGHMRWLTQAVTCYEQTLITHGMLTMSGRVRVFSPLVQEIIFCYHVMCSKLRRNYFVAALICIRFPPWLSWH